MIRAIAAYLGFDRQPNQVRIDIPMVVYKIRAHIQDTVHIRCNWVLSSRRGICMCLVVCSLRVPDYILARRSLLNAMPLIICCRKHIDRHCAILMIGPRSRLAATRTKVAQNISAESHTIFILLFDNKRILFLTFFTTKLLLLFSFD